MRFHENKLRSQNNEPKFAAENWTRFLLFWLFENKIPVRWEFGSENTLSDKILAEKTAENLTCCRKYCLSKYFVS